MGKTGISPEKGQEQNFLQAHWQGVWKGDPQKDGGAEKKPSPVRRRIFDFPLHQHSITVLLRSKSGAWSKPRPWIPLLSKVQNWKHKGDTPIDNFWHLSANYGNPLSWAFWWNWGNYWEFRVILPGRIYGRSFAVMYVQRISASSLESVLWKTGKQALFCATLLQHKL